MTASENAPGTGYDDMRRIGNRATEMSTDEANCPLGVVSGASSCKNSTVQEKMSLRGRAHESRIEWSDDRQNARLRSDRHLYSVGPRRDSGEVQRTGPPCRRSCASRGEPAARRLFRADSRIGPSGRWLWPGRWTRRSRDLRIRSIGSRLGLEMPPGRHRRFAVATTKEG